MSCAAGRRRVAADPPPPAQPLETVAGPTAVVGLSRGSPPPGCGLSAWRPVGGRLGPAIPVERIHPVVGARGESGRSGGSRPAGSRRVICAALAGPPRRIRGLNRPRSVHHAVSRLTAFRQAGYVARHAANHTPHDAGSRRPQACVLRRVLPGLSEPLRAGAPTGVPAPPVHPGAAVPSSPAAAHDLEGTRGKSPARTPPRPPRPPDSLAPYGRCAGRSAGPA
jgi:hypothetical protein